jgi:hypothetical protein
MKHIEHLIPPTTSKAKQSKWSRLRTRADVENVAEPAIVSNESLTAHPTSTRKRNPWTRVHSHFALMGGFVFDADDSQKKFMPETYTRLTLTPRALRKLAEVEPMLIPDIPEHAIMDKSKANGLAKALVCLQACWFILQVIGRAATSAPISLLEMNTFLHALCCLVIYLAWWHKPLDIVEPELIRTNTEIARKICAWMIMNSEQGALMRRDGGWGYMIHNKDLYEENTSRPAFQFVDVDEISQFKKSLSKKPAQTEVPTEDAHSASFKLHPGQMIHGFYLLGAGFMRMKTYKAGVILDAATLECLRLADSLRMDPGADNTWKFNWSEIRFRPDIVEMVPSHISDFDDLSDPELNSFKGSTALTQTLEAKTFFWVSLLFAGNIYGLVHLIAWNGPFTSLVQRWMWRASCLIIVSPSVIVAITVLAHKLYQHLKYEEWAYIIYSRLWQYIAVTVKYGISGLLALIYLAARVFLLVECFINLSQLPPEVYQIPQWSQYIPHLGGG